MTSDEPSCSSPVHKQTSSASSSHAANNHASSKTSANIAAHHAEVIQKIREMGTPDEAESRNEFATGIGKIWEDYSLQCRNLPNINKVVLDLYRLYVLVNIVDFFEGFFIVDTVFKFFTFLACPTF